MAVSRPSERVPDFNMDAWHQRVLGFEQDGSVPENRSVPGKFLEQLVSDIFVANVGTPLWGWSDARSTWLLDFWADYEPRLLFVLVCTSPAYQLARVMEASTPKPPKVAQVAEAWQAYHQELLQFHHRFPHRSVLVSAKEGFARASDLVGHLAKKWSLSLTADAVEESAVAVPPSFLACHLAGDLLANQREAAALWNEIEATLVNVAPADDRRAEPSTDVMVSFRALWDRSAEQTLIHALTSECEDLKKADAHKSKKLQSQEDELGRMAETNELLVQQLQQMQDEMESSFRLRQEVDQKFEAVQATLADVTKVRDDQASLVQQLQEQVDALTKSRDKQSSLAQQQQEQIDSLTKVRDDQASLVQQLQEQVDALTKSRDKQSSLAQQRQEQIDSLTKVRDDQASLVQQLQEQVDALTLHKDKLEGVASESEQKSRSLEAKQREISKENELLVFQLHQVQEELELTFLEKQALEQNLETSQTNLMNLNKERDELETKISNARKARDKQAELALDRQNRIAALTAECEGLKKTVGDTEKKLKILEEKQLEAGQKNDLLLLQLGQVKNELESTNKERDELKERLAKLEKARDEQAELALDRQNLIAALTAECDGLKKTVGDNEKKLKILEEKQLEAGQENDLLMLQLGQVQKELESTLLQKQKVDQSLKETQSNLASFTKERDEFKKRLAKLEKARDEQAELALDRQNLIAALTAECDGLKKTVGDNEKKLKILEEKQLEAARENDLLLLRLHKTQEEFESALLQNQAVEQSLRDMQADFIAPAQEQGELKDRIALLQEAKNEQTELVQGLQSQIEALTAECDGLKTTVIDNEKKLQTLEEKHLEASEENDLLLQQLHKTQEELESTLVQYEALKTGQDTSTTRWKKSIERQPDYCGYGSMSIAPGEEQSTLLWDISNLEIAGRQFPRLQFETFALGGVAGFRFGRAGKMHDAAAPFLRRPDAIADDPVVSIIPVAKTSEEVKRCTNILNGLASSDWRLLQTLAPFLKTCLLDEQLAGRLSKVLRTGTMTAFDNLIRLLASYPPAFRYDRVVLQQEHREPGYEHLWLVVENLQYGALHCPTFEFRLACANVQTDTFGANPRFEFPPSLAGEVMNSWFEESRGKFGPKLELRFALPNAMDIDVWRKLSPEDTRLIAALVEHLPGFLSHLRLAGTSISRSWEDWNTLAENIKNILSLHGRLLTRKEER